MALALCPHFGICGGCSSQDVPYSEQLIQKEAFISSLFSHPIDPIIPCTPPWHYRNKMEFSFSQAKSGEKFLGLMRKRGRVENLSTCYLTNPWFSETLIRVRAWFETSGLSAYHPRANKGTLRTLTLREGIYTKERMVVLTLAEPLNEELQHAFVECVEACDTILLRHQIIAKKTPTRFEEKILTGSGVIHEKIHDVRGNSFIFRIRPASFFQPNTRQAEVLYRLALECAELTSEETLFDLYCGTGTLGIFASHSVKCVKGIEIVPEAVDDAKANIALNHISNMEVKVGDVGKIEGEDSPSTVIVDPPRPGLSPSAISYLIGLNAKKIVYISCNPVTQASNCQQLESAGYRIERIIPVDQFPHTPHVENIAFLRKIS